MNQAQNNALAALAGRPLTAAEVTALTPLVAIRNDVGIAELISLGRTKHGPTQIGAGTVIAIMGGQRGGEFLDAVTALGGSDRGVYWGFDPVRRGVLDLSVPAAVASLRALQDKLPEYRADLDKLLQVGKVADAIAVDQVSIALNKAQG